MLPTGWGFDIMLLLSLPTTKPRHHRTLYRYVSLLPLSTFYTRRSQLSSTHEGNVALRDQHTMQPEYFRPHLIFLPVHSPLSWRHYSFFSAVVHYAAGAWISKTIPVPLFSTFRGLHHTSPLPYHTTLWTPGHPSAPPAWLNVSGAPHSALQMTHPCIVHLFFALSSNQFHPH